MTRPSRVVVDKQALRHNLQRVKQLAPHSRVMAIIKADAYGHGIVRVAETLSGADAFGVACLEEAQQLRSAGISNDIVLLEGPHKAQDLPQIAELELDIVIHNAHQVDIIEKTSLGAPLQCWIKIDTGMHRLGFSLQEFPDVLQRLQACKTVKPTLRLMTHLATANELQHPLTDKQLDSFSQLCRDIALEKTIANSAAVLSLPQSHCDWVRPGLMLYGVSPMVDSMASEHGLKAVMTLESEIIAIQHLKAGEPVGYGATWSCPEDMPVGIVAAGYGDGFPRHARSGTPVLVNDVRCALIGRASMDMLTIDLRNQPNACIGDRVVLWGENLPIEEIAQHAGTIPYELLCGVHKRLSFIERG